MRDSDKEMIEINGALEDWKKKKTTESGDGEMSSVLGIEKEIHRSYDEDLANMKMVMVKKR